MATAASDESGDPPPEPAETPGDPPPEPAKNPEDPPPEPAKTSEDPPPESAKNPEDPPLSEPAKNEESLVPAKNEKMIARAYQTELLDIVHARNSIICMGTGTGKTFIAIMLIREKAHETQKSFDDGGKRTVFLTNAVALARQQGEVISAHTNLKVQTYVGADGVDQWMVEPGRWETEFRRNQVLVMTAQILLNILQHGLLSISRINLLVFDECHHAKKNHAYAKIMQFEKEGRKSGEEVPHILGLTASIIDKDVSSLDVEQDIAKMESTLNATAITSADTEAMEMYGTKPDEFTIACERYEDKTGAIVRLGAILDKVCHFVRCCEAGFKRRKTVNESDDLLAGDIPVGLETIIKDLDDYRVCLNILGPIAANYVAIKYLNKLEKEVKSAVVPVQVNRRFFRLGRSIFAELVKEYEDHIENEDTIQAIEDAEDRSSTKVRELLHEILYRYADEDNILTQANAGAVPDGDEDIQEDFLDMDIGDDDEDDNDDDIVVEDEEEEEEEDEEEGEHNSDDEDQIGNDPDRALPNEDVTGIIFVERRITSFALHKLLERFFGWDEALARLASGYIVGAGGKGDSRDVHQTAKHQEVTLRAFREKQINLLVSTSVLQEGIDIPKCNLVVLFDVPKNFREYIQAKGRARAAGSRFYVVVYKDEIEETERKLEKYKEQEQKIIDMCKNREESKVEEDDLDDADDYLPPYKGPVLETGAQAMITMSSAVGLINQYCAILPCDVFTRLVPECTYKEYTDNNAVSTYQCTIKMPISCPIRGPITGPIMPRKKLAQMATALQICKDLHKCGEFSDNLLPAYRGQDNLEEILEAELKSGTKLDTTGSSGGDSVAVGRSRVPKTKLKRLYYRGYAEAMSKCLPVAGKPLYLYEIRMTMTAVARGYTGPRKAPQDSPKGFGLLLSKELPKIPHFPIYVRSGEITVEMKLLESGIVLSEEKVQNAMNYHRYVVMKVLEIEREHFTNIIFNPEDGIQQTILVPLHNGEIDWDFVDFVLAKKDLRYLTYGDEFVWNADTWKDAVVTRTYREPPIFYFINEICTDMTPLSEFPNDNYTTFHNYYFERYEGLKINDYKQPLIEVSPTSQRMYLLTPRNLTRQGQFLPTSEKERHLTHFVPELCAIHLFPDSMWRKAICIPSILYRLNCLYLATELKDRISEETGVCTKKPPPEHEYPRLDFGYKMQEQLRPLNAKGEIVIDEEQKRKEDEAMMKYLDSLVNEGSDLPKDKELAKDFVKRRMELEVIEKMGIFDDVLKVADSEYGPSPCYILQALTMAAANDFFSLERLEVIGDSFLKYMVTVYLFLRYPDVHEGKLTNRRMAMINNANLHKLGLEKNLEKLIQSSPFAPNDNWLPPLYATKDFEPIVKEGKKGQEDEIVAYCFRTKQLMFDKNVADSMEALIGCYLITCGAEAARAFLKWLGFKLEQNPKTSLPDPVFKNDANWESMLERETADLHVFEEAIGYKFNNKAYLLEAMTHSSYDKNRVTENYQRLEFLGDAILDYIVTRFLFEDCHQHSPGLLTDLRSALVCNNTFAKLAVKYKYHLSFKYRNAELFYVIDRFVKAQKELGDEIQPDIDDELDEDIQIPKALGDVFESVAGAIFLDSGMCLDTVWRVHYAMMKELIVMVTVTLPKSPVRELMELAVAGTVTFSRPIRQAKSGKMKVTVEVLGRGSWYAIAKNHRTARVAAAKKAVKALKEMNASGVMMTQT